MNLDNLENIDTSELDNAPDLEDGVMVDPDKENEEISEEQSSDLSGSEETEEVFPDEDEIEELEDEEETEDIEEDNSDDTEVIETTDTDTTKETNYLIDLGDKKIEASNEDELKQIAQTALKDKVKYDQYKEEIAILEGIKEEGLSKEDLFLLVEAKKGNKKALAKLLKETGVDPYEIDPEEEDIDNYKPNEYKADMNYIETKAVLSNLQKSDKYPVFENLITKEFDEKSKEEIFKDPNALAFVGELVTSGMFEQISPTYLKNKLLGKGNALQSLLSAYDEHMNKINNKKDIVKKQVETESKNKAIKRKRASIPKKSKATSPKTKKDPLEMSDKEFEEYRRKIMGDYSYE